MQTGYIGHLYKNCNLFFTNLHKLALDILPDSVYNGMVANGSAVDGLFQNSGSL